MTIIGVMADTKNAGFRSEPEPALVVPFTVVGQAQRLLAVRTARRSDAAAEPDPRPAS